MGGRKPSSTPRTAPQGRFDLDPSKVNDWKPPPSDTATMTVVEGAAGESQIIASVPEEMRDRTALLEVAARLVEGVASPEGVAAGQGRASLFRSAVKAVDQWASHPRVDLKDLKPLLADSSLLRTAIEAILDGCDFHTAASARRARLASPSILDTSRVDFETTLAHITTTTKSELSHAACHSRLELKTASALERDKRVVRWVRNFQLGWTIPYWRGSAWARYEPDFIAVLDNGVNLIIECKGVWDDKATHAAEFTKQHWIPSLAGTHRTTRPSPSMGLRRDRRPEVDPLPTRPSDQTSTEKTSLTMASKKSNRPPSTYRHETASRPNQPTIETSSLMDNETKAPKPFTIEPAPHELVPAEAATTDKSDEPQPRLAWDRKATPPPKTGQPSSPGHRCTRGKKVNPLTMIEQLRKPDAGVPLNLFDDFNGLPQTHRNGSSTSTPDTGRTGLSTATAARSCNPSSPETDWLGKSR